MNSRAETSGQAEIETETNLAVRTRAVMDAVAVLEADSTTEDASTRMQFSQGKAEVVDQAVIRTQTLSKHSII